MKKMLPYWLLSSLAIAGLAGCTTTTTQQGGHAEHWEYKVIEEFNYNGQLEPRLNQLAREGWSVVSTTSVLLPGTSNPITQVVLKHEVKL